MFITPFTKLFTMIRNFLSLTTFILYQIFSTRSIYFTKLFTIFLGIFSHVKLTKRQVGYPTLSNSCFFHHSCKSSLFLFFRQLFLYFLSLNFFCNFFLHLFMLNCVCTFNINFLVKNMLKS